MDKIKIIVCCHKKDLCLTQEPYFPLHVGKGTSSLDLGIQGDDTGDNISAKNASYCELTGMYWAWKNLKDLDIIGLCHYRRYFDFHHQSSEIFPTTEFTDAQFGTLNFDFDERLVKEIERGAIVVPKPLVTLPLYIQYNNFHNSDDLRVLRKIVKDICDDNSYRAFNHVMYRTNKLYPFNMFVMRHDIFNAYCEWLFPILKEVEKRIDISNYSTYQKRIFGFMSERLFNVFLFMNMYKKIELPIISFSPVKNFAIGGDSVLRFSLRKISLNILNFIIKNRAIDSV